MSLPARARAALVALLALAIALAVALPALPASAQPPGAPQPDTDVAYEVLAEGTNEPLQVEVAPDGRVIWSERDGSIWVLTPEGARIAAGELVPAANACETCTPEPDYLFPYNDPMDPVNGDVRPDRPNRLGVGGLEEGGLHGLLLSSDFAETGRIFTYRSVAGTRQQVADNLFWGEFRVSTFVMDPVTSLIDPTSEEVVLTVPAEWDHCCHYGGDLDYLPDGTLILATGDDVDPSSSGGYGARDARSPWLNAELTSANPADRRGKLLRFNEDGSVPPDNPFIGMEGYNPYIDDSDANVYVNNAYTAEVLGGSAAGTPGDGWIAFDPYVYSLGWKQPWRSMVMPNGDLYVSDVGPDAGVDDPERGPAGLEEITRVPLGGGTHAGWPRCAADNIPYIDVDWTDGSTNGPLDCSANAPIARPIGTTEPTIRGMSGSPFYYPSAASAQWPIVGSGGKTSEPTFFYPADVEGPLALPERFRDRLFLLEWSRNFILTIPADPVTGDLDLRNEVMSRVTPPLYSVSPDLDNPAGTVSVQQARLMSPADAAIGPDGAIYMVEYGAFYYAGENGRLSRIRGAGAQLDTDANYGLPVATSAPALAAASAAPVLPIPGLALVGVAGLGLALAARRRRRVVV